jgi:alpha-L-fucosidase
MVKYADPYGLWDYPGDWPLIEGVHKDEPAVIGEIAVARGLTFRSGAGAAAGGLTYTQGRQRYLGRYHVARRFGMFFHFNMSTFHDIQWCEPAQDPNSFNPSALDFDQWLDAAQEAGAQYVSPTIKHHDGFCWWPSDAQPYNISQSAWYASNGSPDLLADFYENAIGRGLAVVPYLSVWDRQFEVDEPNYAANGHALYIQHTIDVLGEIADRCPNVPGVWFDGWGWYWNLGYSRIPVAPIRAAVYALWPSSGNGSGAMMMENNHEGTGLANSDLAIYEEGVDGTPAVGNTIPAEGAGSIYQSGNWFKDSTSVISKTASDIQTSIALYNGRGASYMLNVGPGTDGLIGAGELAILAAI